MRISTTWKTMLESRGLRRTERLAAALLAVAQLLVAVPAAAATDAADARAIVDKTIDDVLAALREPGLDSPARVARIEAVARERFDFETMSRLVLRRSWKKFSDTQKVEFVDAFRDHLSVSYGTRIDRYQQQDVKITGERVEPRGDVTISTKIVGGSANDVTMDYRLRKRAGSWRVIDVKIEGVSLISSFRSQFKEVLSRGGPEEVLRRLKEKTKAARPADS